MADFKKDTDTLLGENKFNGHKGNEHIHVTQAEKELWNAAAQGYVFKPEYETNTEGQTYLTDRYMRTFFKYIHSIHPGTQEKKYGVEWPAWPDLAASEYGKKTETTNYTIADSPLLAPWRSQIMTEGENSFIRKLDDNKGLVAAKYEHGISTGEERDDYETIPAFMWWKCNYVKDKYGDTRVTAIKGFHAEYKETGAVDVGVLSQACYIKYNAYDIINDTAIYSTTTYSTIYEKWGGMPVHRVWISLTQHDDTWAPYCASVRHAGELAPYAVHTPYLTGVASDNKWRSQPGLVYQPNMSYDNLWNRYVKNTTAVQYKGPGYMGGSMETQVWGWLMLMLKHGAKSSQKAFNGIDGVRLVNPAEHRTEATSKVFSATASEASTLYPGTNVMLVWNAERTQYNTNTGLNSYGTAYSGIWQYGSASANYVNGVTNAKVVSKTPRNDGSGIVDILLDTPNNFAVPENQEVACAAYKNTSGGILGQSYNTGWTNMLYKENPAWDGVTADSKYVPASNKTAYSLRDAYEDGNSWPAEYQYVPDLYLYTGINRAHLEQGRPTAGITDVVPGMRDGCVGSRTVNWSPFRVQGIEFGQGVWEVCGDVMNCTVGDGTTGIPHIWFRDKNAQNHTGKSRYDMATSMATFIDGGEMSVSWSQYPVEFLLTSITGGGINHGTDANPKYINCGIWPSNVPANKPGSSSAMSYGDYYWNARHTSTQYEILLGGRVGPGAFGGLLYVHAGYGVGSGLWTIAARD